MRDQEKGKRRVSPLEFLLPIVFLMVTVGLYIPSSLFLGNIDEFSVDYPQVLPAIALICAAILGVGMALALIVRRNQKLSDIYIDLIFGITLGIYVQCNFLNSTLKQLNGTEVVWDLASLPSLLSIAVWLICLIVPHVVRVLARKIQRMITRYGSAMLSAMQVVSLVVMLLTTTRAASNDFAITKQDEFLLSSKDNTVVFIIDTLDAQWAEQYVLSEPEYLEKLEGFTYFDNVVSSGAPTILGIRMMFTGKAYDPSMPLSEYYETAYDGNTLFSDLKSHGYGIRLYTLSSYLTGADTENIDNAVTEQNFKLASLPKFVRDLLKLTAYNGAPYPLKPQFLLYSAELTNNATIANNDPDKGNVVLDDPQFYQDFQRQGLTLTDSENAFVLYHFFGAHGPYSMNEDAQRVEQSSLPEQIHGSFKIIFDYLEEMKRQGIYEDSTIIITADHGGVALYQNPAVFVKRKGDGGSLRINSAPLTFANLRATFVENVLDNYMEDYGAGMFDVPVDADVGLRKHTFDAVLYKNVYGIDDPLGRAFIQALIGDPARDNEQIRDASGYHAYELNMLVNLCGENADTDVGLLGFSGIEHENRWTNGNEATISLDFDGVDKDVLFTMDYATFNGVQNVTLYADDAQVFAGELQGGTLDGVVIPFECVQDGHLDLRFELPDAISPKELGINEDTRRLALSVRSFRLVAFNG